MPAIEEHSFQLCQLGTHFSKAGSVCLNSREIVLANNLIQQFWLPKHGLFGARKTKLSGNHSAVLDTFQLHAVECAKDRPENPAKTHLLASILPIVRGNGAQKIFPDACIGKPLRHPSTLGHASAELELQLQESMNERLTIPEFCQRSRDAVQFPNFSDATFDLYREFEEELFGDAITVWWDDPHSAGESILKRWRSWRDGFGRRSGKKAGKDVLNILSYESKAAFHQCYSSLWVLMLPHLTANQTNPVIFERFHVLWHQEQRIQNPGHRDVHLLHGLALGLHPAFGVLLTTETGRRLMGEMIAVPADIVAQERFLHAGLVSLYHYAAARQFRFSRGP